MSHKRAKAIRRGMKPSGFRSVSYYTDVNGSTVVSQYCQRGAYLNAKAESRVFIQTNDGYDDN